MGDLVAHREYSSEGKIDPYRLDMDAERRTVQALIDGGPAAGQDGGTPVSAQQIAEIHNQVGVPHSVRKVFQKVFYNVKDGQLWTRAGLADIWNEVVWDGFVNPVDLLDKLDDPDEKPDSPNKARRGSLISYVLATYREATLARRTAEEALRRLPTPEQLARLEQLLAEYPPRS